MPVGFTLSFAGVSQHQYEGVMSPGSLDLSSPGNTTPGEKWPEGIVSHYAGPSDAGWTVVDIWESDEAFDKFKAERLGAAMEKNGLPEPTVTRFEVYNTYIG